MNSDFVKLWAGHSISLFGDHVGGLALPLTAAVVLGATPMQMGMLTAVQLAPVLVLGMFVGVWIDRVQRRPMMLLADVARAILLASIPAAALLGRLHIEHLYVVALLVGVLSIFFSVASAAYLPSLVGRHLAATKRRG
ncbi:MAG: hypothetical protein ACR2IK_14135 [Chloroflexota bacterium]